MEKRLALALVLCLLLIIINQQLFVSDPVEKATQPSRPATAEEYGATSDDTGDLGDKVSGGGKADEPVSRDTEQAQPAEGYESTSGILETGITLDTDNYRVRFTNNGAALESLKFKKFYSDAEVLDEPEKLSDPEFWHEIMGEIRAGTPSFRIKETGASTCTLDQVCWEHELDESRNGEKVLTFVYKASNGLVFRKVFTLFDGAYHIDIKLEVTNRNPDLDQGLNLLLEGPCGIADKKRASFTAGPMGAICWFSSEGGESTETLETKPASSLDPQKPYTWDNKTYSNLHFAGVANNYFALLLKPLDGKMLSQVRIYALEDSGKVEANIQSFEARYRSPPSQAQIMEFRGDAMTNAKTELLLRMNKIPAPGNALSQRFLFFAGPKKTALMKNPEYQDFYALIEDSYGSMAWINTTLIWILGFFHSIFGNWGVAIIFLTFVVKALLLPLTRVQQVSMQGYSEKMKRLKPKLDELKKKYKNNKKKFNEAQMKIMKEEGVRPPLMGCLLIFLQFPIFIGLFQILRTAFELRHSPFVFWVKDLSQPDALPLPFALPLLGASINVLPIAMTVAFYYQQKMMPKPDTSDPSAASVQKMMRFMPIIFGVMFYGYASGLSLYWMTSNLITIVEYKFIRKNFPVGGKNNAGDKAVQAGDKTSKPADNAKKTIETRGKTKKKAKA